MKTSVYNLGATHTDHSLIFWRGDVNTRIDEEVSIKLVTVTRTNSSNKTVTTCTRTFVMTNVSIKVT